MSNVNKIRIIRDEDTIDYDIMGSGGEVLPIGTVVDYDGKEIPSGWEEVDNPNEYSTSEIKIGTWIDGKPLYRKAIQATTNSVAMTNSNIYELDSNIDLVTSLRPIWSNTYGQFSNNLVNTSDADIMVLWINTQVSPKQIRGVWGTNNINKNITVILEYTKTTDEIGGAE